MSAADRPAPIVPFWSICLAWIVGLLLAVYGMLDGVGMWSFGYATALLLVLAVAPIFWEWPSRKRLRPPAAASSPSTGRKLLTMLALGGLSLGMHVWTAQQIGDLPPAYHDEYSYLFQAKTFLAGRVWFPSHPTHPELFDQMHVLNDHGRMASRYFPGTGLWMAPFVAMGHPYLGHWVCGVLATIFVYCAGCELASERAGVLAGLLTALSPGVVLFGNLLLAHHPTLLGLAFFLWMMSRLERTFAWPDALGAGIGLTWAMLCRPMTAAGFGLPFGIWTAWQLLRGERPAKSRVAVCLGLAIPLGLGIASQLVYNAAITGSPWSSPYQLYTDLYTPNHVYGFDNVQRGREHVGPKVLQKYNEWAENLTPELAAKNVAERLINSWMLSWDLLPLAMLTVLIVGLWRGFSVRIKLAAWAIVSLHVVHIPYWYAGIMGWHYVFETVILWTLLAGIVIDRFVQSWSFAGRPLRTLWLFLLIGLTELGNLVTIPDVWQAKLSAGVSNIRYPRRKQAVFRKWVADMVGDRPALVLVAPHVDDLHLDYVVNDPGLDAAILWGRWEPDQTDVGQIVRDFPDRTVFLCEPDRDRLKPAATTRRAQ